MKKIVIKFSSIFCCLVFVISCSSKPVVNENIKEKVVDTSYINDSITKAKNVLTCDTPYQSVDILIINDRTIEDEHSRSFYSQTDKNGNILSGGKPFDFLTKKPLDPFSTVKTNKVSQKALHYLTAYIDKQCDCKDPFPKDDSIRFAGGYTFRLIQNGKTKTCYVFPDNMDSMIQYLKGLREWLKDSKYKEEFKDLIEYIDYSEKINREDKAPKMVW
ncbi:MAG: hypothetical protein BGO31_05295 [Bacteroidetes bacterium 43-16]|nr:MAG: hypothetical protein BGO31_05295 [Bacteroidetes bacterium 43-16]